jgi:Helix-turn-helix domain, rpiR family
MGDGLVAGRPTPEWRAPEAANSRNVIEELRLRYDLLTHSQKCIADYIVDDSQAIAFSTVDEMTARLGVNPSTIVRFSASTDFPVYRGVCAKSFATCCRAPTNRLRQVPAART